MLYMTAGDQKIIILETGNLEELKKGRPARTPDGSVFIAWTPGPGVAGGPNHGERGRRGKGRQGH